MVIPIARDASGALVSTAIAVVCALGAACCMALGALLQQGVARESGEDILHLRLLLSLLRQPRWIAGVALSAGSFAVMGVALAFAPLTLVQPLAATDLPVAAVTIGATIFGESLAASPALLAVQLAGGAVAVAGIAVLSRSSVVQTETTLGPREDASGQPPAAHGPAHARPDNSRPDRAGSAGGARRSRPGAR